MFLTDEEEMVAKKKYNEGKIDLATLNMLLGRDKDEEEEEEIKDIKDDDPKNFNLLFTGALKDEILKALKSR